MALIALTIFAFLVGQSLSFPADIGFGIGGIGPIVGGCLDVWDVNCVGFGGVRINVSPLGLYPGYPPAVGVARENFVRESYFGGIEFGTRNEVIYRPGYLRPPYSRYHSCYYPYNVYGWYP